MSTPEELLRAIARDEKKRVQRCEFYDRNVCDFEFVDFKVHIDPVSKKYRVSPPVVRSGGPFTSRLGFLRAGHPVIICANSETMLIRVRGELRIETICSINALNADDFRLTKLAIEGLGFPAFIRSEVKPTTEVLDFLSSPDLQRSVQELIRRDTDSLHFRVGGEIALYVRPQSSGEINTAIEILLNFFVGGFRPQRERWNLDELPPEFQHLIPLIRKWAESDDHLRSDLIDEAGEASLHELTNIVVPLFDSINTYLNSLGDQRPEPAIALQTLAECTAEAQITIKDRSDRN
jgi:hypothetical protein